MRPDLGKVIEEIASRFEENDLCYGHGTDNPWDEAVALVLGVTHFPDDQAALAQPVPAALHRQISAMAKRRVEERMPLAYLLGRAQFAGCEFLVEPGVVIPRSPIGQLIVDGFKPWLSADPQTIVDVCCGGGCIGIACAVRFPGAQVLLIDNDSNALELARRNVALHNLDDRVTVLQADLFASLGDRMFDLVVSNPPYVDAVDMLRLPPEYRYEPERALAAGDDGLAIVDRLIAESPRRVTSRGIFVCEAGGSAPAVLRKYPHLPFSWPDLPAGGAGVFLLHGFEYAVQNTRKPESGSSA